MKIILHKDPYKIRFLDDDGNDLSTKVAVLSLSISAEVEKSTRVMLEIWPNTDLSCFNLEGCEISVPTDVIETRWPTEIPVPVFPDLDVIEREKGFCMSRTQIVLSVLLIVSITTLAVMSWCP